MTTTSTLTDLPPITEEDRQFLSYNPNTSDLVEWVQRYARSAVAQALAARPAVQQVNEREAFEVRIAGPDDVIPFANELDAHRHANAVNQTFLADCLKHPNDIVLCVATVQPKAQQAAPTPTEQPQLWCEAVMKAADLWMLSRAPHGVGTVWQFGDVLDAFVAGAQWGDLAAQQHPPSAAPAEPSELVEAARFAADVLSELYAKYSLKIGPFASQAQMANVRLGAALRALKRATPPAAPAAQPAEVESLLGDCKLRAEQYAQACEERILKGEGYERQDAAEDALDAALGALASASLAAQQAKPPELAPEAAPQPKDADWIRRTLEQAADELREHGVHGLAGEVDWLAGEKGMCWPIAKLAVRDGKIAEATFYAPSLPDGEHDVWPCPIAPEGAGRPAPQAQPATAPHIDPDDLAALRALAAGPSRDDESAQVKVGRIRAVLRALPPTQESPE